MIQLIKNTKTPFIKKKILTHFFVNNLKKFFLKEIDIKKLNSYGNLSKKKSLQDRFSFNLLDQNSDDFQKKLSQEQKEKIKKYQRKMYNILFKTSLEFYPYILRRLLGKTFKNSFEIIGYITMTKSNNYLLKAHTDHPSILLTIIIPLQDLNESSLQFLKIKKDNLNLFNKNFQNLSNFETVFKPNIKSGEIIAWVPNFDSWHCVRKSNINKSRVTCNFHLRIKKNCLKKYFGKDYTGGIQYPIKFNNYLNNSFSLDFKKKRGEKNKKRKFLNELKLAIYHLKT